MLRENYKVRLTSNYDYIIDCFKLFDVGAHLAKSDFWRLSLDWRRTKRFCFHRPIGLCPVVP
jgi:hypothetical protein